MAFREEPRGASCPLCGREMAAINELKEFTVQVCRTHGVFVVDKPTGDVWVLDGFDINMTPIRRRWYLVENHRPLTVAEYRDMVKRANYRRLEER